MKNFPFDAYDIGVIVEDTTKDATERKYLPDLKNSNLDKLFKISGWRVDGFEITSKVQKYSTNFGFPAESDSKNSYSRIEVKMHMVRDNLIIFVKVVTPVILFLLISLLGVFLPIDQISQRINLCVGALFSSVAYHVNIASGLPPVSYLTFVDKMMMGNYLLIFMNIFFCIAIFMANKNDYPNLERFLAKSIRIILPTIFVVTYAIFIKHFLFP